MVTGPVSSRARRSGWMLLIVAGWVLLAAGPVGRPGVEAADDPFVALALTRAAREPAPDFTVATAGDGRLSLRALRGQVVFLNFWATWCPPCREEMPAMERLHRRFRERGFAVVAISLDSEGASATTPFVRAQGLTFPIGLDPGWQVASLYAIRALPSTLLIDRDGRVVARALGPREWDRPEGVQLLETLLGPDRAPDRGSAWGRP